MSERLKGLLEKANTVVGGLLGDFPQGFNAGAVAGIAGYPGDMAYLLDTAGRAVTGRDTMYAAQDFPGTTDYIAAKAGYPIPQSFSGQLGAAVGGLMTPGPGDLAKFAPVLSAIPFWHGSPHKYDAVDLSKIGTGEGAQAYGWGYYGADSEGTAKYYSEALAPKGRKLFAPDGSVMDVDALPIGQELFAATVLLNNNGDYAKAADDVAKWSTPTDAAEQLAALKSLQTAGYKADGGTPYLYRGEYRWPDPAKEAATPLTGEDLLDWDRPMSEQSNVMRALKDSDHPSLGKNGIGWKDAPEGMWEKAMARRTGEDLYRDIAGNDQRATSELLQSMGIPGIRYLDQMSRGAGEGTRNYVMFDDKGIKLLERNGEPIKAAEDFAARRAGKAKPYKEAVGVDGPMRLPDNALMGTAEFKVKPPKRLFRGVGEGGSTTGTYALGKGLYTSRDKSFAAMYGEVSEVSPDDTWPRNPLVLNQVAGGAPGAFADWALKTSGLKNMREFNKLYADPGEFVRSLGYDGVIAGDEVVRYPTNR